jgi:HAD superfamily hydrolase (TIGR01509 family)
MSNTSQIDLPQSVVFDMDGTLLDTETPARQAFSVAIVMAGYSYNSDVYNRCIGTSWATMLEILIQAYGVQFDSVQLYRRWTEEFAALTRDNPIQTKPGIRQLLKILDDEGVPMAVATSNQRSACEDALSAAGLTKYFRYYICAGETENAKPAADPYLAALSYLKAGAKLSWGVEDSDVGTLAAVRAGLKVFQIPDQLSPSAETRKLGHTILPSAEALSSLLKY